MSDDFDWSVTTWEGSRLRQHREYLALPFREKLQHLEDSAEVVAYFRSLSGVGETPTLRVAETPPPKPR